MLSRSVGRGARLERHHPVEMAQGLERHVIVRAIDATIRQVEGGIAGERAHHVVVRDDRKQPDGSGEGVEPGEVC